jgi:hypothetical protein
MALNRLPLPSFTLVLTSGPQSVRGLPAAIKLDSSLSHTMRPTVRDHLMQTIDLRGEPDNNIQVPLNTSATRIDYGRIYLQTILEEEEPSTSPVVDKKQANRATKENVLILLQSLRRKLFPAKITAPTTNTCA